MHQPQRVENAKILIANTPMDTDKIKVFGSRVKVLTNQSSVFRILTNQSSVFVSRD